MILEPGDFLRHLFPGQTAAHARLGSLSDLDFYGICGLQVLLCHTVFAGNILNFVPMAPPMVFPVAAIW